MRKINKLSKIINYKTIYKDGNYKILKERFPKDYNCFHLFLNNIKIFYARQHPIHIKHSISRLKNYSMKVEEKLHGKFNIIKLKKSDIWLIIDNNRDVYYFGSFENCKYKLKEYYDRKNKKF